MKVIYAREDYPTTLGPSIFLAGPTPRISKVRSWRTQATVLEPKSALDILEEKNQALTVIIPEFRDRKPLDDIDSFAQLDWETEGLERVGCILFWVPRDLTYLPGYTTNVEFGSWKKSGKVVLGWPSYAKKMTPYLYWSERLGIPRANTLAGTIDLAIQLLMDS